MNAAVGVRQSAVRPLISQVCRLRPAISCEKARVQRGFRVVVAAESPAPKRPSQRRPCRCRTGRGLFCARPGSSRWRRQAVARPLRRACGRQRPVPALKSVLDKLGIARTPTCAVIGGDDYQIVQVEAPDVLQSEMRAAIRWRLRDVINFSVDEATVDVFEIPDPVRRTQGKHVVRRRSSPDRGSTRCCLGTSTRRKASTR